MPSNAPLTKRAAVSHAHMPAKAVPLKSGYPGVSMICSFASFHRMWTLVASME